MYDSKDKTIDEEDGMNEGGFLGKIQSMFEQFSPLSTEAPNKKRIRPGDSPSEIQPTSIRHMKLDLDEDTPNWARTLVNSVHRMCSTIEHNLEQSIEYATDTATDALTTANINKLSIAKQSKKIGDNSRAIEDLSKDNILLKEKLLRLESYSRRDNLVIHGIPEKPHEDCYALARDVIKQSGANPDNVKLIRSHR